MRLDAATGQLVPSLGAGLIVTDFNGGDDRLTDVSIAPDGSIAAAGIVTGPEGSHLGVARYEADGDPEPGFNAGAPLTFAEGGGFGEDAAVAALPDGSTVVAAAGPAPDGSAVGDLLVARLAPDGTLDPAFGGGDGWLTINVAGRDDARSLVVQPDGKLVVGFEACAVGLHTSCDQAVARITAAGVPDAAFSGDGVVSGLRGSEVADGGAGRVLAGGYTDSRAYFLRDFALTRLLDDGSLDPAFSGDGIATADFGLSEDLAVALAVGPDGRPVLAGTAARGGEIPGLAVARFKVADGPADADADGVLNAADACPERPASNKSGCPEVRRKLLVKAAAGGKLKITIKTDLSACAARQRLKVRRSVDGRSRTFAAPKTNERGVWRSPKRVPEGVYRAKAKARVADAIGRCASAKSRARGID
jgi:uncharacterized delta-60 repeat protein